MKQKSFTARIVKREDVTADLFKLWLDLGEARRDFNFNAGQYCTIGLNNIWRPYSIVSAPHEEHLELFVELVPPPEGNLTPLLHKVAVGDIVSLLPKAKGIFTFEPQYKNQVMVATVTGIAPFVSMIRSCIHRQESGDNFYVLHGASYMDEFGYDKELHEKELDTFLCVNPIRLRPGLGLTYINTISRPSEERNSGWPLIEEKGRVNEIFEKYLAWWGFSPADTLVYACGHPGMIEDVKQRLAPKGWKVKEERYWK